MQVGIVEKVHTYIVHTEGYIQFYSTFLIQNMYATRFEHVH